MPAYPCKLRKYRKVARLSQSELSLLAGIRTQGVISEVESGARNPSLAVAMACSIAFGVSERDLFPALHARLTRQVLANARRLERRHLARPPQPQRGRDPKLHLSEMIARISNDTSHP